MKRTVFTSVLAMPMRAIVGLHAMTSTAAEFGKLITDEIDYWAKVIPSIGIQPE